MNGLGKTSITLAALSALKAAKKLKGALIIAPLRVCHLVWPKEAQKWADFHGLSVTVLHGKDKDKLIKEKSDLYVINPEGLEWLFGKRLKKWDTLVIDESTKFKSWKAQRTKLLKSRLDDFDRRWILTGTPAPNSIQDLFSQFYLVDCGRRLGRFVTHFRSRYMFQGGYGGYQWFPKEGSLEDIEAKIRDVTLRLAAEDYLKLPPLIHNRITVELPAEARRQYDELEEQFMLELAKGTVLALHGGALGMKLRQVTNGHVYDEDKVSHALHSAKLDALEELAGELSGKPLMIAIAFLPEVEAIRGVLGKDVPYLGGGVSTKKAQEIANAWNAGKLPYLIIHPASMAHGLNLQGGQNLCWYGLTWNYEEYDQTIRRLWRQGQMHGVVVHSIVAESTKDEDVERALRNKKNLMAELLESLK